MDRAVQPPLSLLGGQLKLGLREESKKETLSEDLWSFAGGLIRYLFRRISLLLAGLVRFGLAGFTSAERFKFWLSRRFVRRKGQLAFPFAHATLVVFSLTVLVATAALSGVIFSKPKPESAVNTFILESTAELNTQESQLTKTEAFTYTVEENEDIYGIAERFRRTVDALASANNLSESGDGTYAIAVGDVLTIPPIEGVDYTVKKGDTVQSISKKFSSNAQQIVEFNYIFSESELYPGRKILVPVESSYLAGDFSAPAGTCTADTKLGWPTRIRSVIGSYLFSHRGIDLPADYEDLYAVGNGIVSAVANFPQRCLSFGAGCNYGYGGLVFIDLLDANGNKTGLQARYGHINKPYVGVGQMVTKGTAIAQSGESGVAFGPHLHFEIYCGGVRQRVNPLPYLE